jgi:hypothetical protein
MNPTAELMPVAKPKAKMGRPSTGRDDVTIRMDRELARKIRILASENHVPVAQYLTDQFRAQVERAYAQTLKGL